MDNRTEEQTDKRTKGHKDKNTAKLYGDALVYPQSLLID